ncbi:Magnesium transport protein CorA [Escherichia coli]|nr:magnesium transporter CorA [Escherichia coli]VCW00810.1 Magnesium transport protein CorA [Escherichia coli]
MLSAFQLENNRLTRLEVEESQPCKCVWIDLVEPDDDERLRVQSELGQSTATRPELEDIEASARFFEDDDGLHIHSSSSLKMRKITPVTPLWHLPSVMVVCLLCVSVNCLHSVCRMRARSQSMVDGNAYELLLDLFETKSNSWQMK